MASNHHHQDAAGDDFLEQILVGIPPYPSSASAAAASPMLLQLGSSAAAAGPGGFHSPMFPLGLSLEQGGGGGSGFMKGEEGECGGGKRFRESLEVIDRSRGHHHPVTTTNNNVFHGQPIPNTVPSMPHPPTVRPRVRARRGQATDPHSIAERLRRERIAEKIRALQELVPSVNKTDRAAMVDEIVDYVKFLRLQVKVLSMSRLGGAGAVAPLVTDIPIAPVEEEEGEGGRNQPAWEKWSNDGIERQVAKLMEENIGAAMQFLQSKALCIMPISLASAIYHTHPPQDSSTSSSLVKPESNPP
ncbi:hypothetical protein Droror1_Dr00003835 [Drosera rotundifolia]